MLKPVNALKEEDLRLEAVRALQECLGEVPFLVVAGIELEPRSGEGRPDIIIRAKLPEGERALVCDAKMSGEPRIARLATHQLAAYQQAIKGSYGVFIAPYISPRAAEICARAGVGHLDLGGNALLSFDVDSPGRRVQVYIHREGKPNRFTARRDLRSIYSPKAERVLRVLLSNPRRKWRLQELAEEAVVSIGQAHNVKERLRDREWLRQDAAGLCLCDPAALLGEWSQEFDPERSKQRNYYSLRPIAEVERELGAGCRERGAPCALAGFSGAERVAPFVRHQRASAYVQGDIPAVAASLGLKEVGSGANVILLEPYDEGVFYGARILQGVQVVTPIQLYLDLWQVKGRGEEAAEAILEQVIRKQW